MSSLLRVEKYASRAVTEAERRRLPRLLLPFELRRKSRFKATLSDGTSVALFLPRGSVLRDGDLLEAEDGSLLRIEAAPENILLVTAETSFALMQAAYHLGNRHIPVELGKDYLKLEIDPVLREMLGQLGVAVREETSPFQPEGGAYGGGHRHGHDETFAEDYALANRVFNEHHVHPDGQQPKDLPLQDDFHGHQHS